MTRALLFLSLLMLAMPAFAQQSLPIPSDPMRGLIWALPKEQVRAFEKALPVDQPEKAMTNSLYYAAVVDVAGREYKTLIDYAFDENDALAQIRHDFSIQSPRPGDCIDHMMRVQRWLDAYTGQVSQPDFRFRFKYDEQNPHKWGWAVYRGDARITTSWQTATQSFQLTLTGSNDQPRLRLIITPRVLPQSP